MNQYGSSLQWSFLQVLGRFQAIFLDLSFGLVSGYFSYFISINKWGYGFRLSFCFSISLRTSSRLLSYKTDAFSYFKGQSIIRKNAVLYSQESQHQNCLNPHEILKLESERLKSFQFDFIVPAWHKFQHYSGQVAKLTYLFQNSEVISLNNQVKIR